MIDELREQAQAIRAEGGDQMLADLLCRAAAVLEVMQLLLEIIWEEEK